MAWITSGNTKVWSEDSCKWLNTHGTLDDVVANAGTIAGKIGEIFREHLHVLPLSGALSPLKLIVICPWV